MNVFDLFAKISLDTQGFSSGLSAVVKGAKRLTSVVGGAITVASGAMVAFGKQSVSTGQQFDAAMSQVAATMGVSVDEIQELRDFAMQMGQTTVFSATQSAQALNYMALAGYKADKSMAMLPNVLNLAAAGGMDLALASDMITDAQSALGLSMDETTELVDKMAKAASSSNTSVSQLGEAILQIGGTAKKLKGGTTELTTILGILADNGMKGAEGGTHLRNMLNSLISPSSEATKMMEDLGISLYDANGDMRSLNDVFIDLRDSMSKMATQAERDQVVSTLFNARDMKAAEALLAGVGDRYAKLSGAIDNAAGAAKEMSETQLKNLSGDITLFKSALEGAQIVVSDKLTPTIREFVQFGTSGLQKLTEAFTKDGLNGAMEVFGEILSDGMNKLVEFLPKAMEAGADLIETFANGIAKNSNVIFESFEKILGLIIEKVVAFAPKIIKGYIYIIKSVAKTITKNARLIIDAFVDLITDVAAMLTDESNLDGFVDGAAEIIDALADGILRALPVVINAIVKITTRIFEKLTEPKFITSLLEAGVTILKALVTGIIDSLPMIIQSATTIITNLVNALNGSIDTLIEGAVSIISAIVENLPYIITQLLKAVPEIITMLVKAFTGENLTKLINGAIQILGVLIDNLPQILDVIIKELPNIITSIINAFTGKNLNNLINGAIKILGVLVTNVPKIISALIDKIPDIITSFVDSFTGENLQNLINGAIDIIDAIVNNIDTIIVDLLAAIPDIITKIAKALVDPENIKTLAKAGKDLVNGAIDLMKSLVTTTIGGLFDLAWDAGEAAGDAINKATGRYSGISFGGKPDDWESGWETIPQDTMFRDRTNPVVLSSPVVLRMNLDGQEIRRVIWDTNQRNEQKRGTTIIENESVLTW